MRDTNNVPAPVRTSSAPIIAAALFFLSALIGLFSLALSGFFGCNTYRQNFRFFPLAWQWSGRFSCYSNVGRDFPASLPTVFLIVGFLVLVGCGIACLTEDRTNPAKAGFIVAVLLGGITFIYTIVSIVGNDEPGYEGFNWWLSTPYLIFNLCVPLFFIVMMRIRTNNMLQWRIVLIFVMALSFVDHDSMLRTIHDSFLYTFSDDIGNIPVYAGLLVIAFAVKPSRNGVEGCPERARSLAPSLGSGILFLISALFAAISLRQVGYDGCQVDRSLALFPLNWSDGIQYLCRATQWHQGFPVVLLISGFLVLTGCGVVTLIIGRRDLVKAGLVSGVMLTCVTVISTVVTFVGMGECKNLDSYPVPWNWIVDYWLYLAIPIIMMVMMVMRRIQPTTAKQILRIVLIVAMGLAAVGREAYLISIRFHIRSDLNHLVTTMVMENVGNVPLFAAVLVLVFTAGYPYGRKLTSQLPFGDNGDTRSRLP